MPLPVAESEVPASARRPRRRFRGALLWALACAACTGVVWALAVVIGSVALGVALLPTVWLLEVAETAHLYLALGAGNGLFAGAVVAIVRRRERYAAALVAGGALFGALAGVSVVLAVVATEGQFDPLLSSSLALAGVGFLAGLTGRFFTAEAGAARWMFAGAACAAGMWLLGLGTGWLLLDALPSDVEALRVGRSFPLVASLAMAAAGAVSGLLVGAFGPRSGRSCRSALLGVVVGALGGGLSVPVMLWCAPWLRPAASSSLLWTVVGALAGLTAYGFRSAPTTSTTEGVEEEEYAVPRTRIEWLLRETRCRVLNRSTRRVLPVLVVSASALVGAVVIAPSEVWVALVAVGALGFAVALVLYRQEERLRVMERRFGERRD